MIGRVVEVISEQTLGQFFKERIFGPLSMHDTLFTVSEHTAPRLCDIYMRKGQKPGDEYRATMQQPMSAATYECSNL